MSATLDARLSAVEAQLEEVGCRLSSLEGPPPQPREPVARPLREAVALAPREPRPRGQGCAEGPSPRLSP
jgi:hypothetical protein